MNRKTIYLTQLNADSNATAADEHAGLRRTLDGLIGALDDARRQRHGRATSGEDWTTLTALLGEFLLFMARTDVEQGPDSPLPQVDADLACADAMRSAAALESWLNRLDLASRQPELDTLILGISLWAMRHDCTLHVPEPLVNALARQANRAGTRQDTAAAYALMQGAIEHLKPQLAADLEQSNPERPWRLLHLNFAITGIKSGDAALAEHAFSALNAGLPHERSGFYEEALRLAEQVRLPEEITTLIRKQHEAVAARH